MVTPLTERAEHQSMPDTTECRSHLPQLRLQAGLTCWQTQSIIDDWSSITAVLSASPVSALMSELAKGLFTVKCPGPLTKLDVDEPRDMGN